MEIIDILFVVVLLFGLVSNFLSIPGNFVVVLDSFLYGLATNFEKFHLSFILTLLLIAALIEFVEYLVIALGARRYGASRGGVVAGIVGGLIGSISGAFFSPVVGALVGGFSGVIIGTFLLELLIKHRPSREAFHVVLGALIGKVGGLTIKAVGTVTMVVLVAYKIFL